MMKERPDLKPYAGQKLTVIAWIWARTVKSPNPAFAHERAVEALSYNGLVQSWPEITRLAREGQAMPDRPKLPGME